jgi:hypothetical protein
MNRRSFFKRLAAIPILRVLWRGSATSTQAAVKSASSSARRVRSSDPLWPTEESWKKLNQDVGGQLIRVESPLAACANGSNSTSCQEVIKSLQNPYYIGDQPGATQTSGWVDGWMSAPSVYAVAARSTADVVAAVNFARENLAIIAGGGPPAYPGISGHEPDLTAARKDAGDIDKAMGSTTKESLKWNERKRPISLRAC